MRIIKMQLELEAKMYEQAQKMSVRMDMHDDKVAELEVQVAMMSKTIDAQDDCEDAYVVPHKEIGLHWHKLESAFHTMKISTTRLCQDDAMIECSPKCVLS